MAEGFAGWNICKGVDNLIIAEEVGIVISEIETLKGTICNFMSNLNISTASK